MPKNDGIQSFLPMLGLSEAFVNEASSVEKWGLLEDHAQWKFVVSLPLVFSLIVLYAKATGFVQFDWYCQDNLHKTCCGGI